MFLPIFRAVTVRVTGPSHSGRVPKSMCCCARINSVADSFGLLTRKMINPEISSVGMMMYVRIARLDIVSIFVFSLNKVNCSDGKEFRLIK